MTYELAKQLKDAGFKQSGNGLVYVGRQLMNLGNANIYNHTPFDVLYVPTLSELIEACGKSFNSLSRVREDGLPISTMFDEPGDKIIWKASCWEQSTYGETPEEAMGNLWLLLKI